MQTTTSVKLPLTITPAATRQLRQLREEMNVPGHFGLKIGIKSSGGCSSAGFAYDLRFDEKSEKDEEFEWEGLLIFMEKAHAIYLLGMEIDWVDGLQGQGFAFSAPQGGS